MRISFFVRIAFNDNILPIQTKSTLFCRFGVVCFQYRKWSNKNKMWKYMTLGVRFSLVMQINWDVYKCNQILGLDYPHFSHCIIVYTLTNQNTYFCRNSIRLCVSVANHPQLKAITLRPADFFWPITYSLLAVTQLFFSWLHTQSVLGWHCSSVLHIRCPVLVFSISKSKKGKLYILWIPAWKTNTSIDHTYIDYLTCPIARMFIIVLLLFYLGWKLLAIRSVLWIRGIPSVW